MNLTDLHGLVIDFQATSGSPLRGFIFEMGWMQFRISGMGRIQETEDRIVSCLVKPHPSTSIPDAVARVAGIKPEELEKGIPERDAWEKLYQAVQENAGMNRTPSGYALVHYARYEMPFLLHLHGQYGPGKTLPLNVICTHEILKRLLPGLPRKGLRPAAGYFGISVPPERRSGHHVLATSLLWPHLVRLLDEKENVRTIRELEAWIGGNDRCESRAGILREYPMDSKIRLSLPEKPGVYRMFRSNGDLLYVGKAKSLKRRVNSYFQKKSRHSEHILEMLSQAFRLEVSLTESALQAALLESDEIKRLIPPYNKALQEKDRRILYYSRDLFSSAPTPDDLHFLGPVPSQRHLDPLGLMARLAAGGVSTKKMKEITAGIFSVQPDNGPDLECFREGWNTFIQAYGQDLSTSRFPESFFRLGSVFWKERLQELEDEASSEDEEEGQDVSDEEEPVDRLWTPDFVFRALKSVIRRGAHSMRRARWLCQLSEGILVWDSSGSGRQPRHRMVISSGIPGFERVGREEGKTSVGVDWEKRMRERQESFDLLTYDRLRVLSGEMKRLVREGRRMELYLRHGIPLDREKLERILQWV